MIVDERTLVLLACAMCSRDPAVVDMVPELRKLGVAYPPSTLQKYVKALVDRGLLETADQRGTRGRSHIEYAVTAKGYEEVAKIREWMAKAIELTKNHET